MDMALYWVIGMFLVVNMAAFLVMLIDKMNSRRTGADRISEGMLFFMAAMFGGVGVYAGMFAFRHKTRKWYFVIGIPLLMFENCSTLYLVYSFLQ